MSVDRSAGLASLSKKLSDGAMFSLRDKRGVESISTGVATVDAALGTGGFVRGGQHILYGSPSSGKSALVYSTISVDAAKRPRGHGRHHRRREERQPGMAGEVRGPTSTGSG